MPLSDLCNDVTAAVYDKHNRRLHEMDTDMDKYRYCEGETISICGKVILLSKYHHNELLDDHLVKILIEEYQMKEIYVGGSTAIVTKNVAHGATMLDVCGFPTELSLSENGKRAVHVHTDFIPLSPAVDVASTCWAVEHMLHTDGLFAFFGLPHLGPHRNLAVRAVGEFHASVKGLSVMDIIHLPVDHVVGRLGLWKDGRGHLVQFPPGICTSATLAPQLRLLSGCYIRIIVLGFVESTSVAADNTPSTEYLVSNNYYQLFPKDESY